MKSTPKSIGLTVIGILIAALVGYFGFMSEDATFKPLINETAVEDKDQSQIAETPLGEDKSAQNSASNENTGDAASAEAAAVEAIAPRFDVVRVEPDGSAVIAGRSEPEWTVALKDGGTDIGSEKAGLSGEWVIVPDTLLPPGNHELTLSSTAPDNSRTVVSEESVTVVIPDSPAGDLLVALNKPGEAIQILNKPDAKQEIVIAGNTDTSGVAEHAEAEQVQTEEQKTADEPSVVASQDADQSGAETGTAPDSNLVVGDVAGNAASQPSEDPAPASDTVVTSESDAEVTISQTAEVETTEVENPTDAGQITGEASTEEEQVPSAPAETVTADATSEDEPTVDGQVAVLTPDAQAGITDKADNPAVTEEQTDTARSEGPVAGPSEPANAPEPSEESDPSKETVVALPETGTVETGTTEADAKPEAEKTKTAAVESAVTTLESQPDPTAQQGSEPAPTPEVTAEVKPAEPDITPEVTVEAVELENGSKLFVAGQSATPDEVRIYVNDRPVGNTNPRGGHWLLEVELSLVPGTHRVRADQLNAEDGSVVARAEVTFEQQEEIQAPVQITGTGSLSDNASGQATAKVAEPNRVIIRRGDNLWTISRRLYGQGIRFSTIYLANTDQIRNPDLIYPGQVFMLPEGDTAWSN